MCFWHKTTKEGEQGWRSGESAHLHQCGPGLIPGLGIICGLSLLLVLVLAPRGFSPGTPVFPSPQKPTFPNSNSIWTQWKKSHSVDPLLIPIYLFYFIYLVKNKFVNGKKCPKEYSVVFLVQGEKFNLGEKE